MDFERLVKYKNSLSGYGELRLHENIQQAVRIYDGVEVGNTEAKTGGVSARVYKNGMWGMSSAPEKTEESLSAVIKAAEENAAFRPFTEAGELPSRPGNVTKNFASERKSVSKKVKLEFLRELDAYIAKKYPGLLSRKVILSGFHHKKTLVTSDGSSSYIYLPRTHIYLSMTADKDGTPIDLRANSIGGRGEFEDFFNEPASLYPEIDALYELVCKKRDGVFASGGIKECVLAPDLAGILAHEAVGHTVEYDLVAGGSVAADVLGQSVASPLVSIVDYANTAFGEICPVPVYIDDEGVLAEDAVLIDKGILTGFMHNKASAMESGYRPTGNARAFAFSDEPLIRMRNTCINPGESKLEDMIASVEDGYYLSHPTNGQADMTSEFMFGVAMGFEIKKGKLGRAIMDTTVSGVAFNMLKTVTMVSDDLQWVSSGFCGKKQAASVGMGGPAIKCEISVGGQ